MPTCSYAPCSKESRHITKGLCPTCYARYQRNGTPEHIRPNRSLGVTECSFCESKEGPFIKSLCRACYMREYKNGTPDRQRVRNLCERPGCDELVAAHGLCQRHAQRVRRHGDPDAGRPEGWGAKSKNPTYETWKTMRRIGGIRGGFDPRWDDFWQFIADVGEKPSPKHRFYRIDDKLPFSKENVEWAAPILDESQLLDNAKYQRVWRAKRPHLTRRNDRKKLYGLVGDEYEQMLAAQGGVCAICKQPETTIDPRYGEPFSLAVDHDKVTKAVRSLLCAGCNTGIGGLKHSIPNLEAAITYLQHHQQKDA